MYIPDSIQCVKDVHFCVKADVFLTKIKGRTKDTLQRISNVLYLFTIPVSNLTYLLNFRATFQ